MEEVHVAEAREWISKSINLNNFFEKPRSIFKKYDLLGLICNSGDKKDPKIIGKHISKLFGGMVVSDKLLRSVAKSCSLKKLRLFDENESSSRGEPAPPDWFSPNACASNYPPAIKVEKDLQANNNLILVIRVYEPFPHIIGRRPLKPEWSREVTVLGTQTLDVLRDQIMCPNDMSIPGDVSENPFIIYETADPSRRCKLLFKSNFIFIGSTFYIDTRDPYYKDNSRVIREWGKTRGLGPFRTANMQRTMFRSLTVKLGYPYVMQHLGSCEHLLVFNDVRLLHPTDCLLSNKYPLIKCRERKTVHYCMFCGKYAATWIVTGTNRAPHDPAIFCGECFLSFNYIDGQKIGNFKAYPYYDKTAVY